MKGFVRGAIFAAVVGIGGVFLYFATGMAPAATSAPPMPFERILAGMALHSRVSREMPKQSPLPADEANLLAGAAIYQQHCAVCHGLPNTDQTAIAKGEFPRPPHLFKGKGVTDDEPGETYWKVANGIRLTGMPGFSKSLTTDQMWQVSLLLANADKLTPPVTAALAPIAAAASPKP